MDPEYSKNLASVIIETVEKQRDLMVSVATGGPRIQQFNDAYKTRRREIRKTLDNLGVSDPNPYEDLWEWHGKWSSGDLPNYRSRRQFLRELYAPLLSRLEDMSKGIPPSAPPEPTGWSRVDRVIEKMRLQLSRAQHEEDFQQVGLLARESLISLAQAVYDPTHHVSANGVTPSDTDAKRMLDAFILAELPGESNEEQRGHARAALKLADALQHTRTANFREAALCAEATSSIVNIIAIITGRRDPADS